MLAAGAAGGVAGAAHAQQAFSSAWFAAKGAAQSTAASTGYLPNGMPASSLTNPFAQQQQANQKLQTSLNNLSIVARAIAAQQSAQQAARLAAMNGAGVPDGLADGGLKIDTDSLTKGWLKANAPTQTTVDGKTTVVIQQTADKAILNWETFNVGKNTLLRFYQDANWAVLNRVNDPLARPSQIQGQIQADGTVMIVNRNGVIFSGSSQINTRNLVAAAANISDTQFQANGLYGANAATPSFTDANGKLIVDAGARINTAQPASVTQGGGYVLLLGSEVSNAGTISTLKGQVELAAGDSFIIRKGYGTEVNAMSTTRGNEVAPQMNAGSTAGKVVNTGLLTAPEGDVTLAGREVRQNGVVLATTTANTRGTIHLLNSASDTQGSVTLGKDSYTAVLISDDGQTSSLNSQRDALIADSAAQDAVRPAASSGRFDNLSKLADRRDQSRVEIVSGGNINFEDGSLTLATGGQIGATAGARSFVAQGSILDVSGAVGVSLPMSSNGLLVNIQGNELRDAAIARDSGLLASSNVWIDTRQLIYVPAGTGGYTSDRWYTAGGLLEVGGYLANQGHRIGEWAAQGGTVALGGREVVTQTGSSINLSGGSLNVQTGYLNQNWLKGIDGQLYRVDRAPADMGFSGVYKGFEVAHARWGKNATEYYSNPLIAPQRILQNGYTVGRDAGRLLINAPTAVLEGGITATAYNGPMQMNARPAGLADSYKLAQNTAAQNGSLALGEYSSLGRSGVYNTDVRIADIAQISAGATAAGALPSGRANTLWLDAGWLNAQQLGGLDLASGGNIAVDRAIRLADDGVLKLTGANIDIRADIVTRSGSVTASNIFVADGLSNGVALLKNGASVVTLHDGATIDVRGGWFNGLLAPDSVQQRAFLDGGRVTLSSSRDVTLEAGSVIDVSSGGSILQNGSSKGGRGGDISLQADRTVSGNNANGSLILNGSLRAYGMNGGGTLAIDSGSGIVISDRTTDGGGSLRLGTALFQSGFSNYRISGHKGLSVADGTILDVSAPVYRLTAGANESMDVASALERWVSPLHIEHPGSGVLSQRSGASLSLSAGLETASAAEMTSTKLNIGKGAVINVDPGQQIGIAGIGQITVDGTLKAWGGKIQIGEITVGAIAEQMRSLGHDRSIWIGENAVLDVAGRAFTALDSRLQRYGKVLAGGSIVIGADLDLAAAQATAPDLFVVVRDGAVLNASGASATIDTQSGPRQVSSNGGSIALASNNGLYLDGALIARAGGQGAAGGTLSIALETPLYASAAAARVMQSRDLVVTQATAPQLLAPGASPLSAAGQLTYGHGAIGVAQIQDGGFSNLNLLSHGIIAFDGDVALSMSKNLQLFSTSLALTDSARSDSRIALSAPYVRLSGIGERTVDGPRVFPAIYTDGASARTSAAQFTATADLLDIQRAVRFGIAGTRGMFSVDRRGFADVEMSSSGDLRFLPGESSARTLLQTGGDLVLAARQLYPTTAAFATVRAGWNNNSAQQNFDPASVLSIRSTGAAPDAQPYSVFGTLKMEAMTIRQGGTIRAPLGSITLGNSYSTHDVTLLPGSITSTSSAGLMMPYGGTVDGIDWFYGGQKIALQGIASTAGVALTATSVDVQRGATIDLGGGGELAGAGFVSGRGGSIDVLRYPLVASNPSIKASDSSNTVYAIVPGYSGKYAPVTQGSDSKPAIGQQITLDGSIPGLPAGTYTLMPASYALLPGAFRVEVAAAADARGATGNGMLSNGSYLAGARLGFADSQVQDSLSRQVILTPADAVRRFSQFNEMSYTQFALADAARLGVSRPMLPADAKSLSLTLRSGGGADSFRFDGSINFNSAQGGIGGSASVQGTTGSELEILPAGAAPTTGFTGVSLHADSLNALGAKRLSIGAMPVIKYGQQGNFFSFGNLTDTLSITLREGAILRAAEVMLVAGRDASGAITIEAGAGINTLGMGAAPFDSRGGLIYNPQDGINRGASMLAVSNGWLDVLPASSAVTTQAAILLGACGASGHCDAPTTLYSEGTIAFATNNRFELGDNVRYGTRNLSFGVGAVNIGTNAALAAAGAAGVLPSGLLLNQEVLDRLLRGDTSTGAPALESLILKAREAVNIFGTVALDTFDANGQSKIANLILGTPAIYGMGTATDSAVIRTKNFVWSASTDTPGSLIAGGAGSGSGSLLISAERITLGDGPNVQVTGIENPARLALGFANVTLAASDRISANHKGSLAVYQSQGAYTPATGYSYTGGNLVLSTPLLTGAAGSNNSIKAGGAISAVAPSGSAPDQLVGGEGLGAELSLQAQSISLATTVALPSGRFTASAEGDVVLTDAAQLDLAGRTIGIHDAVKYSWGGDVILESRTGDIRQAAGSIIDLSARYNKAGQLSAAALGAAAGTVDLQGAILGTASGEYDAGGSYVPYRSGSIDVRAQHLGGAGSLSDQFAALNARLNAGAVSGGRSFQLKQGDLTIGDGLRAGEVVVSLDGGQLTVTGAIDASGAKVGSIRLAARQGLTIAGSALLDAHGSRLRVDSYGKIIDSPNRAMVELNSGDGQLTLASGARIDLRHGTNVAVGTAPGQNDGAARGTLELNAPRLGGATGGDIAIDASGSIAISGARSISVNAVQRYSDATYGSDPAASGRPYQIIDQNYLDQKHADSTGFITAALGNATLMNGKLAGLNNATYANAFHLRPGVEIVSATPNGDLVVQGDLDLSAHRYVGVNPNFAKTGIYGSGEVGSLVIRAGGNLDIYGSINDGFAPPPATPDDDGWMLRPGVLSYGGDVIVPRGNVTLADGTIYPGGRPVNYDLPVKALTVPTGTQLPVESVLNAAVTLAANTILAGDIRAADGSLLYASGTRLGAAVTLPVNTRLGAGFIATTNLSLQALVWPKGVALPASITINGDVTLPMGGLIPALAELKLPAGAISVPLRAADSNGYQGANWAVASMLPAGSQSWSMRLVAGADTAAADTRTLRTRDANGNLTLADTHFSVYDKHAITIIPGTPAQQAGGWFWSEQGALDFEQQAGAPIGADWGPADLCADTPSWCVHAKYVWNNDGPGIDPKYIPGTPVLAADESWCPDLCTPIGQNIPGTPDQTIIGALIDRNPASPIFSVVRTGTGDLDLVAGRNIAMRSPYGVYTAGTQSPALSPAFNLDRIASGATVLGTGVAGYETLVRGSGSTYQAWYPTSGGNVLLRAGGSVTGDAWTKSNTYRADGNRADQKSSADPANWLWRQGDVSSSQKGAAWWINFGTYVASNNPDTANSIDAMPYLVGFTGYGTLGGGDLRLEAGGHAGTIDVLSATRPGSGLFPRSQALTLAVASTGRVNPDGSLSLTGGGDMDVRIGGALNGNASAYMIGNADVQYQNIGLNGLAANLRGHVDIAAANQGTIQLGYGANAALQDGKEVRAYDAFRSTWALAGGGLMLMPGDATFNLTSRDDLVLAGVRDAGRTASIDPNTGRTLPWFTLWSNRTAIDLFAAGGNLTPSTQLGQGSGSQVSFTPDADTGATAGRFYYPSILRAAAPSGSIYMGASAVKKDELALGYSLVLAPSPNGELELLAGQSIYAGGYAISRSSADMAALPTPLHPATSSTVDALAFPVENNLFAFGPNTASGLYDLAPARFYAGSGDIVGLRTGEILSNFDWTSRLTGRTLYEGGGAVWIKAGRDIVNSGTNLSQFTYFPMVGGGQSTGNFIAHHAPTDVSIVAAGRDIVYSSFSIAGPGALELTAGRNIRMDERAGITSLGAIVSGDNRPGASVYLQAGVGAGGPDYNAFMHRYLDPANLAVSGIALAQQPGKAVKIYDQELAAWLLKRYGFSGTAAEALAYFSGLAPAHQSIFLQQVYFAELREGGREYNDPNGVRYQSYLRGREAIATLFPQQDGQGNAIVREGDITMFGGAGVRTNFGGDIQLLAPAGRVVIGVEGTAPPASAGLITQGAGDIGIYSKGSLLLGLSRIMTTFGGGILAWSAEGDINAGRGAKTTVLYTPPKRVYDNVGDVTLSPQVPSNGAGIATLAPIPEVPAGDVDLIAPLGTIDAGEAGIRVSGNVNLAALQVVNAANIQVKGEATGIPMVAAVNVGALTNASAAASSAATAAQDSVQRARNEARQALPSIFTVRVLGFGNEASGSENRPAPAGAGYDKGSAFQVLGQGDLTPAQRARLTETERRNLMQ
ncbi:filamentous hemagglutinin family protein [Herbaspirillum chlorophenolicum]|uniref:Filamentous hemagglutinin family protein n=1 Tax=Herbaspirillum chlorophenolicum TaxID=211589 RepID=A0ABW8F3P4_9BURK